MARRGGNPRISIQADQHVDKAVDDARRSLGKLEKSADRSSGKLHGFATLSSKGFRGVGVAATGMTAGVGAAAAGIGILTKQFVDSQKVSKQTDAVLKSTGGAAKVTAKHVSDLATAISRKTGIDDEAIQSGENLLLTFTKIHNETGKGNKIFDRATKTVTDMSAALGQDTKSSAIQLGKALNDPIKGITALQRVGVSFTEKQKDQIKTLVDHGKTLDAQKVILKELNKEFGGSAKAQATAFDKLKVSAGNIAETLGGFLAPALSKAAGFVNKFLIQMQDGTGAGGKFVHAMVSAAGALKGAWNSAVTAVRGFVTRNRAEIDNVVDALKTLGKFFKGVFEDVIVPAVKNAIGPIKQILGGIVQIIRGMVRIVTGIITGDWKQAWSGLKDVVSGAFRAVKGNIGLVIKSLGPALVGLAGKMISALVRGLGGLAGALKDAVVSGIKKGIDAAKGVAGDVISAINPFGDGIGRLAKGIGDGVGGTLSAPGGAANLMGADPDLLPFAATAARFGLRTTSGLRPGAITSSGNVSYHSSGDAIDEAGSPGAMLRFFRFMRSRFGPRLRELIYTPGGVGIKDGHPFRYTGEVAADHMDHVHVAYTGPFGDGIGQAASAARAAGFRGRDLITAIAIAGAESRYHNNARLHTSREDSRGMWQINTFAHPWAKNLYNAGANARAAYRVYRDGGGFGPWSTFTSGAYRAFLGSARAAAVRGGGASGGPHGAGDMYQRAHGQVFAPNKPKIKGAMTSTALARIDRDAALAALTPDTADDIAVADRRVAYWRGRLRIALGTRSIADDTTAATELKSAIDARAGLNPETDTSQSDATARLADLMAQSVLNQARMIALAESQGPQLLGALYAGFNGSIGGRVGLGFQGIRSPAGSVAGL